MHPSQSPSQPLLSPLVSKVAVVARREFECRLPLTRGYVVTLIAEGPTCQQQRRTSSAQLGTVAQGGPTATWWRLISLCHCCHGRASTGTDPVLRVDSSSTLAMLLPASPFGDFRCFIRGHSPLSCSACASPLFLCPPHPEAAGVVVRWSGH